MENIPSHELYKIIIETSNEGIWVIDAANKTTFTNSRMADLVGYEPFEMLGKTPFDFMRPETVHTFKHQLRSLQPDLSSVIEFALMAKSGKTVWAYMNTNPIFIDGTYKGAVAMVTDITEKKIAEKIQQENLRDYLSLFEDSPVPIWDEDFSGIKLRIDALKQAGVSDFRRYVEEHPEEIEHFANLLVVNKINHAVVQLNEAQTKSEVLHNYRLLISEHSTDYILIQIEAIANGQTSCEFDAELITLKGNIRFVHFRWSVVKGYEETYRRVHLTTTDVTDRIKEENLILQQSNREKETLLKEIHHRVKNNLQIISSLLRLQSNTINDDSIHKILNVSLSRINSMATVHELLYQSDEYSKIDYRDYLERLVSSLVQSIGDRQNIQVDIEVDAIHLTIETAIPLGLLINEILTNSLKHAFIEQREGCIYINLQAVNNGNYRLLIGDNGNGFRHSGGLHQQETLGLSLIDSLSEQLSANMQRTSGISGTHYKLVFHSGK